VAGYTDKIREEILLYSKDFKTSWVKLGQFLYAVWNDKLFYAWGFEKFEYYVEQEVGLKKATCYKLLKSYGFLEEEEPAYLKEDFSAERGPQKIPGYEEVNFLRMAKGRKELLREDYQNLKKTIFDKGADVSTARRELTAIMKQRKDVDPDEERRQRNETSIRKLYHAIQVFKKDMETLKIVPSYIIEQAEDLMGKLENILSEK
jgi:hypothetical protein